MHSCQSLYELSVRVTVQPYITRTHKTCQHSCQSLLRSLCFMNDDYVRLFHQNNVCKPTSVPCFLTPEGLASLCAPDACCMFFATIYIMHLCASLAKRFSYRKHKVSYNCYTFTQTGYYTVLHKSRFLQGVLHDCPAQLYLHLSCRESCLHHVLLKVCGQ